VGEINPLKSLFSFADIVLYYHYSNIIMKMATDSTLITTTARATEASVKEQNNQQQQQQQFDLETETRNKVIAELQEINRQYQQRHYQQDSNTKGNKFIKFADGQRRRLAFMDFDRKLVQNKDFATGELIPDSYSTRYFFSVVDVTNPDNPVEARWERGPKEAKTILFWLSKNYNDIHTLDCLQSLKSMNDEYTLYYHYNHYNE
jgi:hypothetical protein